LIFTSIQIKINENYKGTIKPGTVIEILRYGGVWPDGRKTFMVGAPHFKEREEVLLFLEEQIIKKKKLNYSIIGLQQGKYSIENGYIFRESNVELVIEKTHDKRLLTKENPMHLDSFINLLGL